MNRRIQKYVAPICLATALVFCAVNTYGQRVTLYPGSTINFGSSNEGSNDMGCPPSAGDTGAFIAVLAANGWGFQSRDVRQYQSGVGSKLEVKIDDFIFTTVHPELKKLLYWTVTSHSRVDRQAGVFRTSCSTSAVLQGNQLDDGLSVDIGVLLSDKLRKGDEISPISVSSPFYCGRNLQVRKKDSTAYTQNIFECKTIGIAVPAYNIPVFQTENRPR